MPDDCPGGEADDETDVRLPNNFDAPQQRPGRNTVDTYCELIADDRRRRVLSFLRERPDEAVPVDRLVDAVTEREWPDPGPVTHRRRVAIDLHHVHLPKLADAGVIEFDPVAGTVRSDEPEALATLLAVVEEMEREEA